MKQNDAYIKGLKDALAIFEAEEFQDRADWLGLCAFRRALNCRGTDGHTSAFGTPNPKKHNDFCPYAKLRALLEGIGR